MGNIVVDAAKELGANDKTAEGIDTAVSILSSASSYFDTGVKVLQLFGFLEKQKTLSDQLNDIQDILVKSFSTIMEIEKARETIDEKRFIASYLGKSHTQANHAYEYKPKPNLFWLNYSDMTNLTREPLEVLLNDKTESCWIRTYYEEAVYDDEWSGPMPPPHEGRKVFDYRVILPACLDALACRFVVLEAAEPNIYKQLHKTEFSSYAQMLLEKHDTIRKAIAEMKKPEACDLTGNWVSMPYGVDRVRWFYVESKWKKCGNIYGVVEKYSGFDSSAQYNLKLEEIAPKEGPEPVFDLIKSAEFKKKWEDFCEFRMNFYLNKFIPKYAVRMLMQRKKLYDIIGLPNLLSIVNHLRHLAGETRLDESEYHYWSLREVYKEMSNKYSSSTPQSEISVRKLASMLEIKDQISLRQMFEH